MHGQPTRAWRRRKLKSHGRSLRERLDLCKLCYRLDPTLHGARLGRLVAEALDEALGALPRPRDVLRAIRQDLDLLLSLHEVALIVAGVLPDPFNLEADDAVHLLVQELSVVADEDERARERLEEEAEPGH